MAQLLPWCKGEGIDPDHAILVTGIPEDTEVNVIERALESIKVLGRIRVRGRMYDPQHQCLTVLCECREKVNTQTIPLDVLPEGGGEAWRIMGPSAEENEVVEEHQMPSQGGQREDAASPLQACSPEAIIRAVGDLMERTKKSSSESTGYRRLRTFSGGIPIPTGEEQLDNWIEQARFMVEECEIGRAHV